MKPSASPLPWIVLLAALLAAVGGLCLQALADSRATLKTVVDDRVTPLVQLGEIQARMLLNARLMTQGADAPTPEAVESIAAEVRANIGHITEQWLDYQQTYLTPEEKLIADRFTAARMRYVNDGLRPALAAMQARRFDEARRLAIEVLPERWDRAQVEMKALMALQLSVARAESEAAAQRYGMLRWAVFGAWALGLLAALALARRWSDALSDAPPSTQP